jgi:hypothetical protein
MENNKNIPPPLTIEEIRNLDLSNVDPTPPNKIYDELVCVIGEAYRDPACNASAGPSNQRPKTIVEDEVEHEEDPRSK